MAKPMCPYCGHTKIYERNNAIALYSVDDVVKVEGGYDVETVGEPRLVDVSLSFDRFECELCQCLFNTLIVEVGE